MPSFAEYLHQVEWTSDDICDLRCHFSQQVNDADILPDEEIEKALFRSNINLHSGGQVPDGPRFNPLPTEGGVDPSLIDVRVAKSCHSYTKAIYMDYLYESSEPGKAKVDQAEAAALLYAQAVKDFSAAAEPLRHFMAAVDAISRSAQLLMTFGKDPSASVDAAIAFTSKLGPYENNIRRSVNQALLSKLKSTPALKAMLQPYFQDMMSRINFQQQELIALLDTLHNYQKHSDIPEYMQRLIALQADAALSQAALSDPLIGESALYEALRKACDAGCPVQDHLLRAIDIIHPEVVSSMTTISSGPTTYDLRSIDPLITSLSGCSDAGATLIAFGGITNLVPSKVALQNQVDQLGQGIAELIATVVPIGKHGPSGLSMPEVRLLQAYDCETAMRSALLEHIYDKDPNGCFQPNAIVAQLRNLSIVSAAQEGVLLEGLSFWHNKKYLPASAILLPIVENLIRRAYAILGGRSGALSATKSVITRHGGTITPIVEEMLGEDWAAVYRHLFDREGAPRHCYAHGTIEDLEVTSRDTCWVVFLFCAMAHRVVAHWCEKASSVYGDASNDGDTSSGADSET